jgi:hypothetical protein
VLSLQPHAAQRYDDGENRVKERTISKRIVLHGQSPGIASPAAPRPLLDSSTHRVYLLSPAHAGGQRAKMLFSPNAKFDLAQRLRTVGIALGEAFSFMSPLYFRGKLLYASTFAKAPDGVPSVMVITPCRGLVRPETIVSIDDLSEISDERVAVDNPKYRDPLERDLALLSQAIGSQVRVVLLGSIATRKYLPVLSATLGERLMVPREFVGLGNMSRGALLLRCSREKRELEYIASTSII